jgi:hypothetical protein
MVHPLRFLRQQRQQLLRRGVVMERARLRAVVATVKSTSCSACWISGYIIENIARTMRHPARRRLKVGIAVDDTQIAKTHGFIARAAAPTFSALAGATNTIDRCIYALFLSQAAKM